jgi:hypothetical protein
MGAGNEENASFNLQSLTGYSRYPGLHIWARNTGKRIAVKFPEPVTGRYLLVQAGKQLEHISGGLIKAGYHEVVVNESTVAVRLFLRISRCMRLTAEPIRLLNRGRLTILTVL